MVKYVIVIITLLSISLNIVSLSWFVNNPFVSSKTTSELLQQPEICDKEFYRYLDRVWIGIDKNIAIPLITKKNVIREVSNMPYIVIESKKPFYWENELNSLK